MTNIDEFRSFYARFIVAEAGVDDSRLVAAFSAIDRECFVGPGPWNISTSIGYISTGTADPRVLYQNILIGLAAGRKVNNGQPTLHARCMSVLGIADGATVIHVGAGTGYYTAVLAHLVGPSGHVSAYEIDQDLAQVAERNLSGLRNVSVLCRSGTEASLPTADIIYVSAGATHPVDAWLHALVPEGRLIFPLTPDEGLGGMLLITRKHECRFSATFVSAAGFIPCIGARDETTAQMLGKSFGRGGVENVRSLRLGTKPDESAWCVGNGWWLSTKD